MTLELIACTSFHPRKVLTTGEGAAYYARDEPLSEQLGEVLSS